MSMRRVVNIGLSLLSSVVFFGCSAASEPKSCDISGVSAADCDSVHEMLLPDALPPSPGNRYADDEQAAHLGFSLFFDSNMGGGVSCATCHAPELAFADHQSVSMGKSLGNRNSPTTFNAARLSVFFWDGRADSLWSQPLFPIENPAEMASSRLELSHFIAQKYKVAYESVFGPLPDMSSWPSSGMPGDPAFDGLTSDVQTQVNRVFANVGKSVDAYMRKNATSGAPLDAFIKGDPSRLTTPQVRGLALFLSNQCQSCHSGPMFTDQGFHNEGFPSLTGAPPDTGREGALKVIQNNPFNLDGPYADTQPGFVKPSAPQINPTDAGAFRTPSLRNVSLTFPYGHDGALASLVDVLTVHAPSMSTDDQNDLIAFLQTLKGTYPVPPWNNWPTPQ